MSSSGQTYGNKSSAHQGYTAQSVQQPPTDAALNEIKTTYLCGECNSKVELTRGDPIRCKECGHRVLYKMRTNRLVQFEAR